MSMGMGGRIAWVLLTLGRKDTGTVYTYITYVESHGCCMQVLRTYRESQMADWLSSSWQQPFRSREDTTNMGRGAPVGHCITAQQHM